MSGGIDELTVLTGCEKAVFTGANTCPDAIAITK
jgi:hypothetical protein